MKNQPREPREDQGISPVGNSHDSLPAERSDVEQDVPGFFFSEDKRDERGHIRPRAAVFENPQEFAVGSRRLPRLVGKIARELPDEPGNIAQPLAVAPVAGHTKGFPVKKRFPLLDILFCSRKRIRPGPGFFDLVDRHTGLEDGFIGPEGRTHPLTQHSRYSQSKSKSISIGPCHITPSFSGASFPEPDPGRAGRTCKGGPAPREWPTCPNVRGTCARGTAENSPCHPGIPGLAATSDRSLRLSLPRLPPPWQPARAAYQGFARDPSRSPPYDRGNAGAIEWRGAFW